MINPAYVELWTALKADADLEKIASIADAEAAAISTHECAKLCDRIVNCALKLAQEQFPQVDLRGKEASMTSMVKLALSLRDTHAATGEKLAASNDDVAANLQKLACAVYADEVLSEQLTKLAGNDFAKARLTQLLGREYMVDVMRHLLD